MLQENAAPAKRAPEVRKLQALLAEFVGTFFLILVARLSSNISSLGDDGERRFLALGFTLAALVYSFDHISGAHFNPAVTFGMVISRGLPPWTGLQYVVTQVLGAICGGLVSRAIGPSSDTSGFTPASYGSAWAVEFIFTFALILVQQNVGAEKNSSREPNSYFGIAVAFTVLAGACSTYPISGGCFNPAIGTGAEFATMFCASCPVSMSNLWLYWTAPLAGALAASLVSWFQNLPQQDGVDLPAVVPLTELIGTFLIVITASLTSGSSATQPLAIGSMVLAMVYMGDHVCGADYNPAVTLGAALRFGTPMKEWWKVGVTIAAQFIGAVGAALAAYGIEGKVNLPNPGVVGGGSGGQLGALTYEILWSSLLVYMACAVMTPISGDALSAEEERMERAGHSRSYQGLAMGFTVAGGIYGGIGSGSGGVFNPALGSAVLLVQSVILKGDGSFVWIYWLGPFLGSFIGAALFSLLHYHNDPDIAFGEFIIAPFFFYFYFPH
jgi:aquaporin Z